MKAIALKMAKVNTRQALKCKIYTTAFVMVNIFCKLDCRQTLSEILVMHAELKCQVVGQCWPRSQGFLNDVKYLFSFFAANWQSWRANIF